MEIIKQKKDDSLVIKLAGRLDTTTAPELEKTIQEDTAGVSDLAIDMEELEYISSAGLRVLLMAQKIMNKQGEMHIRNVCDEINEVFEITGFSDILNIE